MKAFDERAEAAAARDDDGGRPDNVKAVRRALATSHGKLEDDLASLDVLLHLQDGPNSPSEQGPPQPGSHTFDLAIEFFGRIADDIRKIRTAVSAVDFDPDDKEKFRLALKELAAAFDLRARAFGTADPRAAESLFAQVAEREKQAARYRGTLQRYLPEVEV